MPLIKLCKDADLPTSSNILVYVCVVGMQKSLRSDFDMAYERGRISVSAEEGAPTLSVFTRVSYFHIDVRRD